MLLSGLFAVNMSGEENIGNVNQPSEMAHVKSHRASAKAAATRAITAVDKLMAVDSNLRVVKERMVEFDQLLQEFSKANNVYIDRLTNDKECSEADEYWQKAIALANEFSDVVGAWIAELEDRADDEHIDEYDNDHDDGRDDEYNEHEEQGEESRHEHIERTLQHNAALEAKVKTVRQQQALEMKALELEIQELEEQMKLERQRIKLQ